MNAGWRRWSSFVPASIWALTLFVLSAMPGPVLPPPPFRIADKIVHAVAYALLGALTARGFRQALGYPAGRAWALGALAATLYGVTDELHQIAVPGRSADVLDLLADAVGACVGAAVDVRFARWWGRRSERSTTR